MKSYRFKLFVVVLVLRVGLVVGGVVQAEELFDDLGLEQGFALSTVRSSMKPNELGVVLAEVEDAKPRWRLA